jgi:hypothetical protein
MQLMLIFVYLLGPECKTRVAIINENVIIYGTYNVCIKNPLTAVLRDE